MKPFHVCLAAAVLIVAWWLAAVYGAYGADWTALFCTGADHPQPPQLSSNPAYTFPGVGFDGQFYRYLAHDPFFRRGIASRIEHANLRCRRILVPLLAWLLALGQPRAIDAAFILVTLGFAVLGVYWTALYLERFNLSASWGSVFLALPSTILGLLRMTAPDVALSAFTVAFLLYAGKNQFRLFVVLALAPLARETGLILLAAYCGWLVLDRQWRRAALFATAALPWFAWFGVVNAHTSGFYLPPATGFLLTIHELAAQPLEYARASGLALLSRALDWVALIGAWTGLFFALAQARHLRRDPGAMACLGFALLSAWMLDMARWYHVFDFGRVFSPLYLLLALQGARDRRLTPALPLAAMLPRMLILPASNLLQIAARFLR